MVICSFNTNYELWFAGHNSCYLFTMSGDNVSISKINRADFYYSRILLRHHCLVVLMKTLNRKITVLLPTVLYHSGLIHRPISSQQFLRKFAKRFVFCGRRENKVNPKHPQNELNIHLRIRSAWPYPLCYTGIRAKISPRLKPVKEIKQSRKIFCVIK